MAHSSSAATLNVFSPSFGWINLTPPVAVGGECEGRDVKGFKFKNPLFATIYHAGQAPNKLEEFIDHVAQCVQGLPYVCKCHGPIMDRVGGKTIGALWDKVDGTRLDKKKFRTRRGRIHFAHKVALTVRDLFQRGLIYSDLKPDNLFVNWYGDPIFIDMLSVSTVQPVKLKDGSMLNHQLQLGDWGHTPPEFIGSRVAVSHTEQTMAHSLLVLLWEILKDEGPYALKSASGTPVPMKDIQNQRLYGRFESAPAWMEPVDTGIKFMKLAASIRSLFNQGFIRGRREPAFRPSVQEIVEEVEKWNEESFWRSMMLRSIVGVVVFVMGMILMST